MFNKKVLGALAKVVALLLLAQAAFVIVISVMAYAGTPTNLDPSVTQAIAIIQQLGSIAFLYVVLGAAYRLATKCRKMKCEICPNCGNCMAECTCSESSSMSMPATKSAPKKTAAKKSTAKKTTAKKSTSRAKKK